jgi:hypothetical protein
VGSGHDYYYPTGVADGIALDYNNQTCGTSAEIVSAYGLAVAEQELVSGYCNTDGSNIWGYTEAINTSEQIAVSVQEPGYDYWYKSDEAGNIFYGQFQECMENPEGQHTNYVCSYDNWGPLF